jgi:hypothetical protein
MTNVSSWEAWHDIEQEDRPVKREDRPPIIVDGMESGPGSTAAIIERGRLSGRSNQEVMTALGHVGVDPKPYAGGVEPGAMPVTHVPRDPLEFGV